MTAYTDRDIARILAQPDYAEANAANPDLRPATVLVTDGAYTTVEPRRTEHELQAAVIAACDALAQTDERYAMIFAIPNGGARDKVTAGKLKAEGVRAGVPDLFLACAGGPNGQQHGLFIELKIKPNRPRTNQMDWMQRLRKRGYACEVCYDSVQAVMDAIAEYLEDA